MDNTSYITDACRELAALPQVDVPALRSGRLARLQGRLTENDLGGILLHDPINIRYATDCRTREKPTWPIRPSL